jgi:hypothetical protein
MTQEQRDKWCAALRSGTYRQGYGAIRRCDRYCAIGVLCDVTDPGKWEMSRRDDKYLWKGMATYDAMQALKSTGLFVSHFEELITMNDFDRQPFEHIADWIEQHVEVVL